MNIGKAIILDEDFNPIESICKDCYFDETECPFKNRDEIVDVCAHYSKIKKSTTVNFDKELFVNEIKETSTCDDCVLNSVCDFKPFLKINPKCKYKHTESSLCDNCLFKSECNSVRPDTKDCPEHKKVVTEKDVLKTMVRKNLYDFMGAMERVLKENDHKGGWKDESINYLYEKFEEEVSEITEIKEMTILETFSITHCEKAILNFKSRFEKELLDVANICMMIWSKL